MKTSLYLEAPADLSVGTVRISGREGTIKEWVATPDDRVFSSDDIVPGSYLVEISPAGVASQSVLFDVAEGENKTVTLPRFSALASTGSNTAFLSHTNEISTTVSSEAAEQLSSNNVDEQKLTPIATENKERRLSVGLSQERPGKRESFEPFKGHSRAEITGGRLEIELLDDSALSSWQSGRVRLTIAIEQVGIQRALVPMYRGGTTISVTPSPLSSSDVTLEIVPVDPMLRALVRALYAGGSNEARAIRDKIMPKLGPKGDPWTGILVGLFSIRFSEAFGAVEEEWFSELAEQTEWAFDSHVIAAHRSIAYAGDTDTGRDAAVTTAVEVLAKAEAAGSPYYAYSDELFAELISSLNELRRISKSVTLETGAAIQRMFMGYQRELALKKKSGATFVWYRRDQTALAQGLLVPDRESTGLLRRPDTSIIFEGRVTAGRVSLGNGTGWQNLLVGDLAYSPPSTDTSFANCPALLRPLGPMNDPNKGRFGGFTSAGGFTISAFFFPTEDEDWVKVDLVVEAAKDVEVELGDSAWFFLHPTFSPPQLKMSFRGKRALLSTEAYGGFTLGVWIPKFEVELECDLAKLPNAPVIIRTR
ncbi:hypothetical protein CN154_33150 [Sinorhizobium meliloti]|uniref:pYEATS domain-containing protein n=1 Tax=Rhizobium meliloti TaxID=382 RepID=UPI000FD84235|nr:pYEATS domain-containing protein [Sinorhizobium meliloti]MDE3775641.1 hypothetical protein [Sinorhizobium meliloti]RVK64327.1 hypothetical protein CN154_33150 [Sinorhizobium meliloti]